MKPGNKIKGQAGNIRRALKIEDNFELGVNRFTHVGQPIRLKTADKRISINPTQKSEFS